MKLIFKFPTRGRLPVFKKTLDLYYSQLSSKHEYQFVITLDNDDPIMNSPEARAYLDSKPHLKYYYGNSKTKIEAVNADIEKATEWDILICLSDDMLPKYQDFDDIIAKDMQKHYPNNDGCLFYNDGVHGRDRLWTLSIISKGYWDQYEKYIYCPQFVSVFCDNFAQYLATKRNKLKYIAKTIIAHEWVTHTGKDELHQKNSDRELYNKDKLTYERLVRDLEGQPKPEKPIMLLSILTPTLEGRKILLNKLKDILVTQLTPQVEWLLDPTPQPQSIGAKRQSLLEKAQGKYITYVDDDDEVANDYVKRILEAIKQDPDCIGFKGMAYKDGHIDRPFVATTKVDAWKNLPGLFQRTIYHICPVKKEIALKIGFKPVNFGEDHIYSMGIKPLLKKEVFIDESMYFYHYRSNISTCNNINNSTKVVDEKHLTDVPKTPEEINKVLIQQKRPNRRHGYQPMVNMRNVIK